MPQWTYLASEASRNAAGELGKPAGFLLPSYRDTRSYGYHMLDSIH